MIFVLAENYAHCGIFFTNQEGSVLRHLKLVRQLRLKGLVYSIDVL